MSWDELILNKDHMIKLIKFIHNQEPNYISGKKYRLPNDFGHKHTPYKCSQDNGQFVRRIRVFYGKNEENIYLKIIDGEKTFYVEHDDFEESEFHVQYKTTYKDIIKLPLTHKNIKFNYYNPSPQIPLAFLIENIKIENIPDLPVKYPKTWSDLIKLINKKYYKKNGFFPENSEQRWWCNIARLPTNVLSTIFTYVQ